MFEKLKENPKLYEVFQWGCSIIIVIFVALLIRNFLFRTVVVKGSSMEPNFTHGDVTLVNEIGYRFSNPQFQDVIVCGYQGEEKYIIKRVIGLPGDVIDFQVANPEGELEFVIYRNGDALEEDYILEPVQVRGDMEYPYTVPEDSYFVMGDNRNASSDSRKKEVGAIKKEEILGKVVFRIWPLSRIGGIEK